MRDAALGALLDMYATSPRSLARASARYGGQWSGPPARHQLLSSVSNFATATTSARAASAARHRRLAHSGRRVSAAASSASPLAPTSTTALSPRADGGQRRHYVAAASPPRSIAVLGGGLTGLTTAWYLTRVAPDAKITLYEASDRLGGWIDTEKVDVQTPDGTRGTVYFERAARMVKPQSRSGPIPRWDDLVFFEMVANLGLADELVSFGKEDGSLSGLIYYPDHLVSLPKVDFKPLTAPFATLSSIVRLLRLLFREPLYRDFVPSLFHFMRTRAHPYNSEVFKGQKDVSVGDFLAFRFGGTGLVDKVFSAAIHGITGGDIWKLSMASGPWADMLLVPDFDLPITHVVARRADYEMATQIAEDKATHDLAAAHVDAGSLWFRNGFSTLTNALADALRNNPNVTIKTGEPVQSVRYSDRDDRVLIATKNNTTPVPYEKVISTIFSKTLAGLTDGHLPSLEDTKAVTIQLVNLWYPAPFLNHPHHAFGYLLPQALSFEQNPECLLGVIFDSDREFSIPTASAPDVTNRGADTVHGTKLTVMMGGHYWDDLPDGFLPDADAAAEMAKRAVARHLGLDPSVADHAVVASSKLCRSCLPQHEVGHVARMRAAHIELEWAFKGRLAVAGQSYQAPGVLPAVRAARDIAMQVAGLGARARANGETGQVHGEGEGEGEGEGDAAAAAAAMSVGDTGLKRFFGQPLVAVERIRLPLRQGAGGKTLADGDGEVKPLMGQPRGQGEDEKTDRWR